MPKNLPPRLRELFAPRPPLEQLAPPVQRKMPAYSGLGAFLNRVEDLQTPEAPTEEPIEILQPSEIRSRKRKRRMEEMEEEVNKKAKLWNPHENPKSTEQAYNTLFVSRLSYKTTAEALKREFELVAPVKAVKMVYDLEGKSRGYAFVELEDDSVMKLVYSKMRGKTIDGHEILVDVERGRTVKDWRPRRLGNVSNTPRVNKPKKSVQRQLEAMQDRRGDRRGPGRSDGNGNRGGNDRGDRGDRFDRGDDRRGPRGDRYGASSSSGDRHERYDRERSGGGRYEGGGRHDRREERRDDRDSYDRRR